MMKLEDLLHNKLDNFDAGFDESAWLNVKAKTTTNASLKDNLNNYDAGFDQQAWKAIQSTVNANNQVFRAQTIRKRIQVAAVAVVALVVGLASFTFFNSTDDLDTVVQAPINQEQNPKETSSQASIIGTEKQTKATETNTIIEEPVVVTEVESNTNESSPQLEPATAIASAAPSNEKPSIYKPSQFVIEQSELCLGEALNVRISGDLSHLMFKVGDNLIPPRSSLSFNFNQSGEHRIALIDQSKNDLVIQESYVQVSEKVNVNFKANRGDHGNAASTTMAALGNDLKDVRWYLGNKQIGEHPEIEYTFHHKGKYQVKMVAANQKGCLDSSVQTIRILKAYNLMATQIFNPTKETWLPLGLKMNGNAFNLNIISSEGDVVFSSNSTDKEWDGIVNSKGKLSQDGDEFYWVAKVTDPDGRVQEYGGSFIISTQF